MGLHVKDELLINRSINQQPPIALRAESAPIFSVRELTNAFMDLRLSGQRMISLEEIGQILDKKIEEEDGERQ